MCVFICLRYFIIKKMMKRVSEPKGDQRCTCWGWQPISQMGSTCSSSYTPGFLTPPWAIWRPAQISTFMNISRAYYFLIKFSNV